MLSSCVYLQLSQGVVTLLLARSLLCAQRDQLVNAVSHCSESRKQMVEKKKITSYSSVVHGYNKC